MDYQDQVYSYIKGLKPGRYPLDKLMERDRFIESVKYLIDGDWLQDVEFSNDYTELVVKKHFEFPTKKKEDNGPKG